MRVLSHSEQNGKPKSALTFARGYANAGLSVVPIASGGAKNPTIPWAGLQRERLSPGQLGRHFLADNVGVGIICGAVSGNLEAIDFDHAELFEPFCEEVERLAPGLVARLTVHQTPEQGYHVLYRCPEIAGNQKLARRPDPAEGGRKPKTTIETRGEGGYIVAPGSPGCCHRTGREYVHHAGPHATEVNEITPGERETLFRVAASFDEWHVEGNAPPVTASRLEGLSPGDDFSARTSWEEILTPHGWVEDHHRGAIRYWRRPGKEAGWSATTGMQSRHGNELFCCFTDNAPPLQGADGRNPCTSYMKFGLYATLHHQGDFSAAARELARRGYGEQPKRVDGTASFPNRAESADSSSDSPYRFPPVEKFRFLDLYQTYPSLKPPIIDGLLRRGETANLISHSKVGKSWLAYGLAISIILGRDWLGRFATTPGRVLLIDNELHKETLSHRIPFVAEAMGVKVDEFCEGLDVWSLRGNLRSLQEMAADFAEIERGEYAAIILDAKYRFAATGTSENDNAAEAQFYNLVDRLAEMTNAAFIMVHHATKGSQSDKKVVDVGAGAGSQARAADAHCVIREHETPGVAVLDAAVRSFAPIEPVALRWEFPLWVPDADLDPDRLKSLRTPQESRRQLADTMACDQIMSVVRAAPATPREIRVKTSIGKDRLDRLLAKLEMEGRVTGEETFKMHNKTTLYTATEFEFSGVVGF